MKSLILEANAVLSEAMDDEGISDELLKKVISLKFDLEDEILGTSSLCAVYELPEPPREVSA